jgi:hypothetical protein
MFFDTFSHARTGYSHLPKSHPYTLRAKDWGHILGPSSIRAYADSLHNLMWEGT